MPRIRFCNLLETYWNRFARTWDVLLHGNPAADVYGGAKLSAGGELGVGVGEEEHGSGEREVLEGLVRSTDGLVDIAVSRYGDAPVAATKDTNEEDRSESRRIHDSSGEIPWTGSMQPATSDDGMVFSGVGSLARSSLQTISNWTEDVYMYGDNGYGIKENPASGRRKQRRRRARTDNTESEVEQQNSRVAEGPTFPWSGTPPYPPIVRPNIPPPVVSVVEESLQKVTALHDTQDKAMAEAKDERAHSDSASNPERWMKYITFGYVSPWTGLGKKSSSVAEARINDSSNTTGTTDHIISGTSEAKSPNSDCSQGAPSEDVLRSPHGNQPSQGRFLIGLMTLSEDKPESSDEGPEEAGGWNSRISLRTLHVTLNKRHPPGEVGSDDSEAAQQSKDKASAKSSSVATDFQRLRVVLYVVS